MLSKMEGRKKRKKKKKKRIGKGRMKKKGWRPR